MPVTGAVSSNVATYTVSSSQANSPNVPASWVAGNSVTIAGFTGGDTYLNQTCTITSTTTTTMVCPLTHANGSSTTLGQMMNTSVGPFVPGDAGVGKLAWGAGSNLSFSGGCDPYQSQPVSAQITTTHLTVSTYISSTQVSLSGNPANTYSTSTGGCFIWGNTDDTAAAAIDTAMQTASTCPRFTMSSGYYIFTAPHFYTQPNACLEHPNVFGSTRFGNIFFESGFEWEGRGPSATTVFVPPDFPETGSCAQGYNNNACFTVVGEGRVGNISINGGGGAGLPAAKVMMAVGVGSLEYFTCVGVGDTGGNNAIGVQAQLQAQLQQVNISACGDIGLDVDGSTGNIFSNSPIANAQFYRVSVDNAATADWVIENGANFSCFSCYAYGSQNTAGVTGFYNKGGTMWADGIDATQIAALSGTVGAFNALNCAATPNTCTWHIAHARLGVGSVATNTSGLITTSGTNNTYLQDSILNGTGSGFSYQDNANVLRDLGGNQYTGTKTSVTGTGQVLNENLSANSVALTTAKLVLSAGWGSTAAVTIPSGSGGGDQPIQFVVTNSGTGQLASPTITYTFPTPYPVSPYSCTATQIGGNNPVGTFTSSSLSKTGVTFTFSLTPTASDTETVLVTCVTQ